jgi:hypothetical protein
MKVLWPFISAAVLASAILSHAADSGYYHLLVSLIDTNDSPARGVSSGLLVDTNNLSPKVTNTLRRLPELQRSGEVFGVRLGQTVEEVVGIWGKPRWIWSRCYGGPRLCYSNASVVLEPFTNRVMAILLEDTWLSRSPPLLTTNDCVRQLGQPEFSNSHYFCYKVPRGTMWVGLWEGEVESVRLDSRSK